MSDKEDRERFKNLITTGSYSTDEELGALTGMIFALALIVGILYGIYWLVAK